MEEFKSQPKEYDEIGVIQKRLVPVNDDDVALAPCRLAGDLDSEAALEPGLLELRLFLFRKLDARNRGSSASSWLSSHRQPEQGVHRQTIDGELVTSIAYLIRENMEHRVGVPP